jgi:hypothetical protein
MEEPRQKWPARQSTNGCEGMQKLNRGIFKTDTPHDASHLRLHDVWGGSLSLVLMASEEKTQSLKISAR